MYRRPSIAERVGLGNALVWPFLPMVTFLATFFSNREFIPGFYSGMEKDSEALLLIGYVVALIIIGAVIAKFLLHKPPKSLADRVYGPRYSGSLQCELTQHGVCVLRHPGMRGPRASRYRR
jgi:hypothetical protein